MKQKSNQKFLKKPLFHFFPIQKHKGPNLAYRKIGQGEPRVIIWINLVVLEHPMLCTKFQGHWPFGAGEEYFLPYMGTAAILVMWPGRFDQTFVPPSQRSSIWNLTLIGPVVSEEKMFKECGRANNLQYPGAVADQSDHKGSCYSCLVAQTIKTTFGIVVL